MRKIDIIGRGNVATHIEIAFRDKMDVNLINPHTLENIDPDADMTLICVSDSAISEVISRLPNLNGILAHTSGTTSIEIFKGFPTTARNFGVFYPLQTFSKNTPLNYSQIPFYIEGSDVNTAEKLFELAAAISCNVRFADSTQRRALHIAAVFSCNFVNHLWALTDEYLNKQGLQFTDLLPLIKETCNKLENTSPAKGQTGPAKRNDNLIIEDHLKHLNDNPELKLIYSIMTQSIIAKQNEWNKL